MVDPRDVSALANAMERLLIDPTECGRFGALSAVRAQEFDWDNIVSRYLELYHRLAAGADRWRNDSGRIATR